MQPPQQQHLSIQTGLPHLLGVEQKVVAEPPGKARRFHGHHPQCWETQIDFTEHFDLERITTSAEDAFAKYLCHTKDGKSFWNVEYRRIKNGELQSIECYFRRAI